MGALEPSSARWGLRTQAGASSGCRTACRGAVAVAFWYAPLMSCTAVSMGPPGRPVQRCPSHQHHHHYHHFPSTLQFEAMRACMESNPEVFAPLLTPEDKGGGEEEGGEDRPPEASAAAAAAPGTSQK